VLIYSSHSEPPPPTPSCHLLVSLLLHCRYLPQGEKVQAVHRFLWQVQYLVSQGFYVVLVHTSYLTKDPNMVDPNMLASNWGNLWRMITELPAYRRHLRGRVFAGGFCSGACARVCVRGLTSGFWWDVFGGRAE
jgi:hypothetical protein